MRDIAACADHSYHDRFWKSEKDDMQIRQMTPTDMNVAVELATRENWYSENQEVFRAFLFHDSKGCFIAEKGEEPVGICIATPYTHAGFIGELIVAEEHRGQGIGSMLLKKAIEYLQTKGIQSIYLDAVPKAVTLYERQGFHRVCSSLRFTGKPEGKEDDHVRAMRKWDLDPVCRLDRNAFGDDRHFFLKWISFIGPDFAKVFAKDKVIIGYITGRYVKNGVSVGPWVMSPDIFNPERLLLSLAMETLDEPLHIGVLEINKKSIQLLRSLGFQEKENPSVRMAWGKEKDLGTASTCFAIGSPAKG